MWGNSSYLRRIKNIEKRLPNTNDDYPIIISLRTEKEGGTQIFKVIDGERVLGSHADLKIKPNQKMNVTVNLVD
jgi:hypothetical protein